jgi:hypothetical protein
MRVGRQRLAHARPSARSQRGHLEGACQAVQASPADVPRRGDIGGEDTPRANLTTRRPTSSPASRRGRQPRISDGRSASGGRGLVSARSAEAWRDRPAADDQGRHLRSGAAADGQPIPLRGDVPPQPVLRLHRLCVLRRPDAAGEPHLVRAEGNLTNKPQIVRCFGQKANPRRAELRAPTSLKSNSEAPGHSPRKWRNR